MKQIFYLIFFIVLTIIFGCDKDESSPRSYFSQCDAPRGRLITENSATVMQQTIDGKRIYYLGIPPYAGGYLVCDMPKELKKEGLKIKFSGYMKEVNYPEGMDPMWILIELTSINQSNE
ncbi:hypothetical protein Q0590_36060 [Rhodocytophaga aerolata]|uniref:Lipoprotein n=1 Tax=Rhodocytophaga aerolata TaxID=455078 RepID=A0ABT8RI32_9BACT|nr:hypothetical protein [Rhodocytophaga aerolata]MDO1451745.1 hypothetical protein [Rhodocytophaga aerolata]